MYFRFAILYWDSFNSVWPAWTCSDVCQRFYSLFLLSSPLKTDGGGWRTTDRMSWLYIPEQLLTDSLNKSGRNNDWEATNTAWTSSVILYINERNHKSYQDEEGRGHVDREVSKKQEALPWGIWSCQTENQICFGLIPRRYWEPQTVVQTKQCEQTL